MRIKVHSMVDVITNSSTVIFITVNKKSVGIMFELMNEILKVADSDKKAEDLFTVEIEQDWNEIIDKFMNDYSPTYSNPEDKAIMEDIFKVTENMDYTESNKYKRSILIPYLQVNDRFQDYNQNHDGYELDSWLVVKAKDSEKSTIDLWDKIRDLFNVDGYYNG